MTRPKLARSFRRLRGERRICEAVEVVAVLGDSIVGVKHCVDPRGGKTTRAIAACGIACLLASAIAFGVSVRAAASDAARRARDSRVLERPAYAFRPHRMGELAGGVVFGGLALGLVALTAALLRAGRERERPCYRIGTAPGVDQPLEGAPAESFPLVAPAGDGFVLHHGPGIEGELIVGGGSAPLSELAAIGRPSAAVPGAREIPIPPAAEILARVGGVTFLVSSVERPPPRPAPAAAPDLRALGCVAGSLAVHLAIVHPAPPASLEEDFASDVIVCPYEPDPDPEPEVEPDDAPWCQHLCVCVPPRSSRSREEMIEQALEVARTTGIFATARLRDLSTPMASMDLGPWEGFDDGRPRLPRSIPSLRGVEGGALDPAIVRRWIKQHEARIDDCYEKELLARPGLTGTVSIRFRIGPAGKVQRSIGEGFDHAVARCVAKEIERIAFPAPRDRAPATVSYRFTFRPAG